MGCYVERTGWQEKSNRTGIIFSSVHRTDPEDQWGLIPNLNAGIAEAGMHRPWQREM